MVNQISTHPALNFDGWKPVERSCFFASPLFFSQREAQDALNAFRNAFPHVVFHINDSQIYIKRADINLNCYRNTPLLAMKIREVWQEFITPSDEVHRVQDIKAYNEREKECTSEALIAKLQLRFEEAQRWLASENPQFFWSTNKRKNKKRLSHSEVIVTDAIKYPAISSQQKMKLEIEAGSSKASGAMYKYEDRHCFDVLSIDEEMIPYFAIFDGHGGEKTAEYLSSNIEFYLKSFFEECFQSNDRSLSNPKNFHQLQKIFLKMSRSWEDRPFGENSGSTATVAFIVDHKLWVVNVGDSRAVLSRNGKAIALSIDQQLETEKQCRSVWKRGQNIVTNEGVRRVIALNMSRAVGHDEETSGINPRGQVICYDLERDKKGEHILILASDGLFSVGSSSQVVSYAQKIANKKKSASEIAKSLVNKALQKGSKDDISVIIAKWFS